MAVQRTTRGWPFLRAQDPTADLPAALTENATKLNAEMPGRLGAAAGLATPTGTTADVEVWGVSPPAARVGELRAVMVAGVAPAAGNLTYVVRVKVGGVTVLTFTALSAWGAQVRLLHVGTTWHAWSSWTNGSGNPDSDTQYATASAAADARVSVSVQPQSTGVTGQIALAHLHSLGA